MSNIGHVLTWLDASEAVISDKKLSRPIQVLSRCIGENSVVRAHSHNWGQLIYAIRGTFVVTTSQGQYLIPQGQAIWIAALQTHQLTTLSGVELASFYISNEESSALPGITTLFRVDAFTQQLFHKAKDIDKHCDWFGKEGRLLRFVRDCILESEQLDSFLPFPADRRIIKAIRLLEQDYGKLNLNELANRVGASEKTVARLFLKETGLSFRHWKKRFVIQQAIFWLNKDLDVAEVAHRLGYETTSAFVYMFRVETGQTPGVFKKAWLGNKHT